VPFFIALKAGSFSIEFLLFIISQGDKAGAVAYIFRVDIHGIRVTMLVVLVLVLVGAHAKSLGKCEGLGGESSFLSKFLSLEILQLLLAGCFDPPFKIGGEGKGLVNDVNIKSAWQPYFKHFEGALFLFIISYGL